MDVADQIARWKEASYVVVTAGQFDVVVELICTDRLHLMDVVSRIRELDEVDLQPDARVPRARQQLYNWGVPGRSAVPASIDGRRGSPTKWSGWWDATPGGRSRTSSRSAPTARHGSRGPSTLPHFDVGVVEGVQSLGLDPREVRTLFHGTTVTTNAVITKTGAPTALVTTRGFRDVLEIRRQTGRSCTTSSGIRRRRSSRPAPPGGRRAGRLRRRGGGEPRGCVGADAARKIRARNLSIGRRLPDQRPHESGTRTADPRDPRGRASGDRRRPPTDILPEPPEFERTATTVANAYCAPVLRRLHGCARGAARPSGVPTAASCARHAQRRRHDDDRVREGRVGEDAQLGPGGGVIAGQQWRLRPAGRTLSASTWAARAPTSASCSTDGRG